MPQNEALVGTFLKELVSALQMLKHTMIRAALKATVGWGEHSWEEEMMTGFFDVTVDPAVSKTVVFIR